MLLPMLSTLSSDWLLYTSTLRAQARWIKGAAGNTVRLLYTDKATLLFS